MSTDAIISPRLKNEFRYSFPYPVAINYKRIGGVSEANANKLMYILKTSEMIVRLLAIITLCDIRYKLKDKDIPDCALKKDFKRRFSSPSFGTWFWILRESLILLHESGSDLFIPELFDFHFTQKMKPTEDIKLLNDILIIRNRFIHDKVSPDEWLQPKELPLTCEASLKKLEKVLAKLMFLADYPLIYVSPIIVEKKRYTDPQFIRDTLYILGCADQFDKDKLKADNICESSEVLLFSQSTNDYLNLDPFIIYSNDGMSEITAPDGRKIMANTNIYDVFLYNGGSEKKIEYIACNKGGNMASKQSPKMDYLHEGYANLISLFSMEKEK